MTPLRPGPCAPPTLPGAASPSCPPPPHAWLEHARALHADALQGGDGPTSAPSYHPLTTCRFPQPRPRTLAELSITKPQLLLLRTIVKNSHWGQPSPWHIPSPEMGPQYPHHLGKPPWTTSLPVIPQAGAP